jgi:hypothetical protein
MGIPILQGDIEAGKTSLAFRLWVFHTSRKLVNHDSNNSYHQSIGFLTIY